MRHHVSPENVTLCYDKCITGSMNSRFSLLTASLILAGLMVPRSSVGVDSWNQPAGPNHNWQVEGEAPTEWSVIRNENIRWRTLLPEAGMSSVAVSGDLVFTTTHMPIEKLEDKEWVTDIIGFCLKADTGEILWQVTLPGNAGISLAGGFTDGTVFGPIAEDDKVWFFNRCGSMGCYDFDGNEIWFREWKPRFKHNNRQAEPFLVGDTILYVEVADKENGSRIQKWAAPGKKGEGTNVPEGVEPRQVWTYIHGIDKNTGEILWREDVGTSIHNTPVVGKLTDVGLVVAHGRGGGHGPLEKPYGHSLTSLAPGSEGKTLWNTDIDKYSPFFSCHFDDRYAYGFIEGNHLVMDVNSGKLLRRQPLTEGATLWKRVGNKWVREENANVSPGKNPPNTKQANLVVGDWHYFPCHNIHYLARVNVLSGKVEYLELPSQLMPDTKDASGDQMLWGKLKHKNKPLNAKGFAIGNKGHDGSGWGHISSSSPIRVGPYLYWPAVTGTTYVIDTRAKELNPDALVAVNDLGPGGETWTLASLSYANGCLYAHTMREVICIEAAE